MYILNTRSCHTEILYVLITAVLFNLSQTPATCKTLYTWRDRPYVKTHIYYKTCRKTHVAFVFFYIKKERDVWAALTSGPGVCNLQRQNSHFLPLSYRIKFTWSHKIFDAQIKITRHIAKVLYSDVTGQRSSNHFRSEGDINVKCSNNNK